MVADAAATREKMLRSLGKYMMIEETEVVKASKMENVIVSVCYLECELLLW